jgi:hypothetical protein
MTKANENQRAFIKSSLKTFVSFVDFNVDFHFDSFIAFKLLRRFHFKVSDFL